MAINFESKRLAKIACALVILMNNWTYCVITSNSRNDPYPVFTTLDPETFLYTYYSQSLKGITPIRDHQERFSLSISPFTQGATKAKTLKHDPTNTTVQPLTTDPCLAYSPCKEICIEIGDIDGKWAMVGLILGDVPKGAVLPPALVNARQVLYPDVPLGTPIDDPYAISPTETYGFFTVPVCYRKRGIRFEAETLLTCDIGLKASTGFANITQWPSEYVDLTPATCDALGTSCNPVNPNFTPTNIKDTLMIPCKRKGVFEQIGLDGTEFEDSSIEDIRAELYWRHAYLINYGEKTWAEFLLIPFLEVGGSIAAGKPRDYSKAFGLSFGSQDHHAVGATAGINLDFTETVVIGAEAGVTHFFSRDVCNFRVPNSRCQTGIYPFATDVNIQPGNNEFFAAKLAAYHFLGRLSFWGQWALVKHLPDRICLKRPDDAFFPEVLERRSEWKNQVFNAALNYDIAPNIALGVLWQAPFKQEDTYRSTTLMFTFNVTF